jgi:ribonucleotide reductase alpha subunit
MLSLKKVQNVQKAEAKQYGGKEDFSHLYWETTQETLVGLYARRDSKSGQPCETVNDIIYRVAFANAIAELKYSLKPEQLIALSIDQALAHPSVQNWAEIFAQNIGSQRFWANTPGNINADPELSLKVLKYWAHGTLAGYDEAEIWLVSDDLRRAWEASTNKKGGTAFGGNDFANRKNTAFGKATEKRKLSDHEAAMGQFASELRGKGCLAACGVAYVDDTLEDIQDTAKIEALAAKAAMGMGLNTSTLRPWSSMISNGAAASGPDRFYEKTISKAVEAVAQGGRRGGALIELRNSDHPDILFFLEKKRLIPAPSLSKTFRELRTINKQQPGESGLEYKKRLLVEAEQRFGVLFAQYVERQNYLKNTNITVLAMPGFMEAVREGSFYPATFNGKRWHGPIYDPRKPVIDEKTGFHKVNKLTKEAVFEEYCVDLTEYPEALEAARAVDNGIVEITETFVRVRGHIYAPDVFERIVEGMRTSGEPGLAFYDTINAANANNHVYELHTCNPCGEQFLPAGPGYDGRFYMGTCNLTSAHAAHKDFWHADGSYNMDRMRDVASVMQRFMDNVTDVSWYPLPAQNMTSRLERRNGGGFAGVAEYLSRLELEFGSTEALDAVEQLYREFTRASVEASQQLAEERGTYPLWTGSRFERKGLRVRNACMTNNAPTGTLAQAMQTSWGVDPHNGIVFSRKVRARSVDFVAPGFRELMEKYNAWPAAEEAQQALMSKIRKNHKSCRGLDEIPMPVQKSFPVRVEIEPEAYIRHLAAIHKGASDYPEAFNSVSNTCSIPLDMSDQSIADATLLAYELGVKDVTFYPDGSRLSQPVEQIARDTFEREADLLTLLGHQEHRDINIEETSGLTYKVRVGTAGGGSTLHVSLNHEVNRPGELIEIYARMGKPGAIESGLFEAVGRLASAFLQYAAQFGEAERQRAESLVIQQLINIQSGYPAFFKFNESEKAEVIQSPADGLAKAILKYREAFTKRPQRSLQLPVFPDSPTSSSTGSANPNSGSTGYGSGSAHSGPSSPGSTPYTVNNEADPNHATISGGIYSADTPSECSSCGLSDWLHIDGCWVCQACGYSRCG